MAQTAGVKRLLRVVIACAAASLGVWYISRAGKPAAPSLLEGPQLITRSQKSMGAEARFTAWTSDPDSTRTAFDDAARELVRLEALMTVWQPASDIVRLNEAAGGPPVTLSPEVIDVLEKAREMSEATGGAFDVTFGALADVWKFDHDQDDNIPSNAEIQKRLPLVDYRALTIDTAKRTAALARPGMRAHLGGIGKGYAVDRVAAIFRSRAVTNFMIQFGGDMYVAGTRGDRPWRIGIQDPRGDGNRSFASLDLSDASFSTSGDYERFFMRDGIRYHHIMDPRTGQPARGTRSVTIVADNATTADALSTGVFVMGPVNGMALIERLPKVEGVIVSDRNEVLVSSGLKGRLMMLSQPTDAP